MSFIIDKSKQMSFVEDTLQNIHLPFKFRFQNKKFRISELQIIFMHAQLSINIILYFMITYVYVPIINGIH